ncbi:MAG: FGGY-family carbohydrate kinase [Anaerolineaceae bacterium]
MASNKSILAVDVGTSGVKVALITISGQVVGWESQPLQLILTPDGGTEQAPDEWWQAFVSATKRLIKEQKRNAGSILAVCCSTQGEGTLPVDKNGKPLSNCILWMDMRGAADLKKQLKGFLNIDGAALTKVLHFIRLTGGMPSMTGKDPAGHMLYIRDELPAIYEKTYQFLNVLDYMNLRLTGRYTATADSILTSWVTDNRDPDAIHYDDTLIRTLGIDKEKLPEIVSCTTVLGTLLPEVAAELGLNKDVKVVAGSIDNTAAAIGAGAVEDYAMHLYIGTSSWMAAHVPYKKTDITSSLASVPCAVPGRYLLTALQATAGGNLTFLRDKVLYHQDELLQEADVPDIFKVLDQIAERVPAGSHGVIYTPWIWGERAPVDDRTVRAGLFNISLNNNREDIIRAFLEGIAFNTRWMLAPVEKFLKRKVETMTIVGGGAQSNVWCQIFADVMNMEIKQAADPICANARGAAWIAAAGLGEIRFADIPRLVSFQHTYQPKATNRSIYDDRFAIFCSVYKQMKGIYQKLNG